MKAKITTKFSQKDFEAYVRRQAIQLQRKAVLRYQYAGENFVRNARAAGSYNDVTGNLRNSVGYGVGHIGQLVKSNLDEMLKGAKNEKDRKSAREASARLLKRLIKKYPAGVVLVVFAGMNYAMAVESKGRDVITGSVLVLQEDLKQIFKRRK